jgi:hypothetical protein
MSIVRDNVKRSARQVCLDQLREGGESGTALSTFVGTHHRGYGMLPAFVRDAVLDELAAEGLVEQTRHRGAYGSVTTSWRLTAKGRAAVT